MTRLIWILSGLVAAGIGNQAIAACDLNQATRVALQAIKTRDLPHIAPGDCLGARLVGPFSAPMIGRWKDREGYVFTPVFSSDGPHDYVESVDWRWQVMVPFDECDSALWVATVEVRTRPGPVLPLQELDPPWYCKPIEVPTEVPVH